MREEGYYWVKWDGDWHIGYFRPNRSGNPSAWTLTAYVNDSWWLYDSDFESIDEKRLTHELSNSVH